MAPRGLGQDWLPLPPRLQGVGKYPLSREGSRPMEVGRSHGNTSKKRAWVRKRVIQEKGCRRDYPAFLCDAETGSQPPGLSYSGLFPILMPLLGRNGGSSLIFLMHGSPWEFYLHPTKLCITHKTFHTITGDWCPP